jgi:hypothetical protein
MQLQKPAASNSVKKLEVQSNEWLSMKCETKYRNILKRMSLSSLFGPYILLSALFSDTLNICSITYTYTI